jgi:hypothetical protein
MEYVDWDYGDVYCWDEKSGQNVLLNPEFSTKEQAISAKKHFDDFERISLYCYYLLSQPQATMRPYLGSYITCL